MIHGDLSHLTASFDGIEPSIMARMNIVQPSYIHIYIWNISSHVYGISTRSLVVCRFGTLWFPHEGDCHYDYGVSHGILKIPKHQSKTLLTAWLGATHTIKDIKHQNDNILWIPSSKLTACHGKRMNLAHWWFSVPICTYYKWLIVPMLALWPERPAGHSRGTWGSFFGRLRSPDGTW